MSHNQQFANQYNLPLTSVERFNKLGKVYADYRTNELNGATIEGDTRNRSRAENSKLWADAAEVVAESMDDMIKDWGFDHLDFGVGLYPTIQTTNSDTSDTIHFVFNDQRY